MLNSSSLDDIPVFWKYVSIAVLVIVLLFIIIGYYLINVTTWYIRDPPKPPRTDSLATIDTASLTSSMMS